MPDTKISALTAAGTLTGTELTVCVQSGADVKTTVQDIANLAPGSGTTFNTPVSGAIILHATTASIDVFKVQDDGSIVLTMFGTPAWAFSVAGTPTLTINWTGFGPAFNMAANGIIAFNDSGSGTLNMADATHTFLVSGWTTVTIQLTGATPGFWGGPGVPADIATAIDRIANVVSVGGTSPIP